LLAVAVVATGIFALPSTVSLFSGQHSWYELSAQGNNVPCEKCHADIGDEMASTGAHANIKCEGCHNLQFVRDSMDEPLMEGANEAGSACHTRIGVNITWTKNEYLEFTVTEDSEGNWTIACFAAGGENVTQVNSSNSWTNP
jgi:hypothetical protein